VFGLWLNISGTVQRRLVLNALGGDDIIDATQLERDAIRDSQRRPGVDVFLGSEGGDVFNGGDGDLALGGAGDDVFAWNPGTTTMFSRARRRRLLFNGANVASASIFGQRRRAIPAMLQP
jgi:Ca2+-binding RTX toxin-like protein